jgi:hypothetical protein
LDKLEQPSFASLYMLLALTVLIIILVGCGTNGPPPPQVRASVQFTAATVPNESGSEAIVTNTNNEAEYVTITASRPSTGETKSWSCNIVESDYQEIGSSNGWAFQSGDQVTVSENGYQSLVWTMN